MSEKKDDVFIAVLKYMRQETIEGRALGNYDGGVDHIHAAYPTIDREIIRFLFSHGGEGRTYLAPDAYFQLMEHEELQEARLASGSSASGVKNSLKSSGGRPSDFGSDRNRVDHNLDIVVAVQK